MQPVFSEAETARKARRTIADATARALLVQELVGFCQVRGVAGAALSRMQNVVDELVMNAQLDAPRGARRDAVPAPQVEWMWHLELYQPQGLLKRLIVHRRTTSRRNQKPVSVLMGAAIVDAVFATMKQSLVNGELVKLVQFGTLVVRDKSPRRGRNPKTGESMTISKRQMISFRPSKRMRTLLNK